MLTQKQKELIERFGVIQEQMGLSPASARVNALLTISETSALSFDDIKDNLNLKENTRDEKVLYDKETENKVKDWVGYLKENTTK